MNRLTDSPPGLERDAGQVREVELLPGETVTCVFSPERGVAPEPPARGRMLVTTNRRLLAFYRNNGRDETLLTTLEEVQSASVRPAPRRWAAVFKGALLAAAGIAFYLVVAYWLTGRIDGPSVPVINLDVAPLALLLGLLGAAWMLGGHYLANEDGSVLFMGRDWRLQFPYRAGRPSRDIYQVVNSSLRRAPVGVQSPCTLGRLASSGASRPSGLTPGTG